MSVIRLSAPMLAIMAICVCGMLANMPCYATESFFPESEVQETRQNVIDQSSYYNTLREKLGEIDPVKWTNSQRHDYLEAALWTIFYGLNLYFEENGSLPDDLSELAGTSYIPVWPGNPYNEWKPVQILSLSDGFSPGDATLQVCPHVFWSYIQNTRPVSCELSIFGPDMQYGDLGDAQPMKSNTWAVIPDGAVFMLGQHAEPASVSQQKYEQKQAKHQ